MLRPHCGVTPGVHHIHQNLIREGVFVHLWHPSLEGTVQLRDKLAAGVGTKRIVTAFKISAMPWT